MFTNIHVSKHVCLQFPRPCHPVTRNSLVAVSSRVLHIYQCCRNYSCIYGCSGSLGVMVTSLMFLTNHSMPGLSGGGP